MPTTVSKRAAALTPRQREVVRLLSLGCSDSEIGKILKISPSTANNHRSRAMQRLGTGKAAIVARLALKARITSLNDRLSLLEKRRSGRKGDGWN